ncbi:acetoin dehydrogenase dihydrolipoyllysine-residue acetyltransferase subunit [Pseudoalteromonas sp. S3260]|uniref:alpha/beta fold hydrolase n=1 Tax=unclassified Pseudoalteromonas TaxID=194690 RepID=UPI00097784C5|nr:MULTISPECIES: alpha/beta hydrolase [unclassified Pseudoalteromonas]TMO99458.1 acetoin dehydrogenase dihydrolipoyllysine-residue acetyltransferase subunit [Pseudoalteromonas sp. S3260]
MQPFSVKANDLDIHGIKFGDGEDVVIALHGWLDNCASFVPMLSRAAPSQTWYCIDFPGHGLSSWRSPQAHYYFIDYVDDVYALITALKLKKVHLVGHSMGAMVAGLFASCFSEYVKSVSFIEGIGCVTTDSDEVCSQLRNAILNRARFSTKKSRVYTSKQQIYQARAKTTDLNNEQIALLMDRNIKQMHSGFELTCDPKLKNHSGFRFDEAQCIGAIKELIAPCQLILGDKGYPFVKQNLDKYSKYYNNLSVIDVPGGHHCHMQSSGLCFEHIHAFMVQSSAC